MSAQTTNKAPIPQYNKVIESSSKEFIMSSVTATEPNKANPTTIGPMVVPNELTAPPKVIRVFPVAGSPNVMAKGWAAVCCNENPNATINKLTKIPENPPKLTAAIMANEPKNENNKP